MLKKILIIGLGLILTCCIVLAILLTIDGYKIVNKINNLIVKTQPIFNTENISWCKNLREHVEDIKQEYVHYISLGKKVPSFKEVDHVLTSIDLSDIPWKVVMLRVYNKNTNNMQFFPKLQKYLQAIPGCSLAMFSILESGKKIPIHRGPYAGILRYHLALEVPPVAEKSQCNIVIDNITYSWNYGQDVLFDDTYPHYVQNNSQHTRVILLLDVERPLSGYIKYLNKLILYFSQYSLTVEEIVSKVNKFENTN